MGNERFIIRAEFMYFQILSLLNIFTNLLSRQQAQKWHLRAWPQEQEPSQRDTPIFSSDLTETSQNPFLSTQQKDRHVLGSTDGHI